MKKILTVLLALLMTFTLVGCNEEPTTVNESINIEEVTDSTKEEDILGGFVEVEDGTLTDELKDIFDKALDGLLGATYEPVELVATQVVAGTNYKFLASGTKTTNPITKGTYYVTIYEDLDGNVKVLNIETIEEKQEEAVDKTTLNYWVVFYNPDGNELQRTAQKYGTVPKYEGSTPQYWDSTYWYDFVGWTDKKGNDITEFKPIKGNTYIYAKYEMGGILNNLETASNLCNVTVICDVESGASITRNGSTHTGVIQYSPGTTYTVSGGTLTIGSDVYTYSGGFGPFVNWAKDGSDLSSSDSGTIETDSQFAATFGPPM